MSNNPLSMPYRSRKQKKQAARAEGGLVVDMVRQFADPYAFTRELVQNGLDAGATAIRAGSELTDDGTLSLFVRDDGEGMGRDIIEGPLLTLFASAKDGDSSKIGKYGVGFVSVFAIAPHQVVVETWRQDASWLLRLNPDHSYDLEVGSDRPGSGTIVTLLKQATAEQFEEHTARARQALLRWCRHASVPISWSVRRAGAEPPVNERIDRPLEVVSVLSIDVTIDETRFVVGPSVAVRDPAGEHNASAQTESEVDDALSRWAEPEYADNFAGFYNRGLTLYETKQPLPGLEGMRLKVMSPHLQHTLSRDNVRHDKAYLRVVDQLQELVEGPLTDALRTAMREAAEALLVNSDVAAVSARYDALLEVAASMPAAFSPRQIWLPLADPVDGQPLCTLKEARMRNKTMLWSAQSTELTAALAAQGRRVACLPSVQGRRALQSTGQVKLAHIGASFSMVRAERPLKRDRALRRATLAALAAAGATVRRVGFAKLIGREPARAAVARTDEDMLLIHNAAWPSWWSRFRDVDLLLILSHEAVRKARKLAATHPRVAGSLLARYLLLEAQGELSKRQSDGVLEAGLPKIGAAR